MQIGDYLIELNGGYCCKVVDIKTTNLGYGVGLYHLKRSENGINCTQWYWVDKIFWTKFKIELDDYLTWLKKASNKDIENYFRTKKLL